MVANFNKKGNRDFFNKELLFKTVGILLILFVGYMIVVDIRIYQKKQQLVVKINQYKKEIDDIQKNNQNLKEEIINADNIDYLEKLGYEQFNQARPGETEYMFINSQQKNEEVASKKNFWQAWMANIGNAFGWLKDEF